VDYSAYRSAFGARALDNPPNFSVKHGSSLFTHFLRYRGLLDMLRSVSLVAVLALSVLLASETGANASSGATDRIIRDCMSSPTGALRGTYTLQDLRAAANSLPGDIREYSGCPEAIQQAINASAVRHAHGVDGGGLRFHRAGRSSGRDRHTSSPAVGKNPSAIPPSGAQIPTVWPAARRSTGRIANSLPRPLLLLLALLVLVAIAGVGVGVKSRVGRRSRSLPRARAGS
jgi:hypothetical protein